MDTRLNETMTRKEIKKILLKHYEKTHGGTGDRELLVIPSEPDEPKYSNCYYFQLDGTPAKGYGIYVPEKKRLWLFDADGKRFKDYYLDKGIIDI